MTSKTKSGCLIVLVFLLALVFMIPVTVTAEENNVRFVALGDSNAYGLSAFPIPFNRNLVTLDGYNDLFAASLDIYWTDYYVNVAWPGDKTGDLLAKLYTESIAMDVKQANIITVGIGGNNLLGPSIAAITGLWGVVPSDYPDDPDGRYMIGALAEAIAGEYEANSEYNPMDDFIKLMDPSASAGMAFQAALTQGMIDFHVEWPVIAKRIRELNPSAEIYVNTVHNPIQANDMSDPLYSMYVQFENLIGSYNRMIESYARMYHYQVVDVKTAFEMMPGSLTFDIAGTLKTAGMMAASYVPGDDPDPELLLLLLQQTDPHPTYNGHIAAYELLELVRETWKPVKPMWTARSSRFPLSPTFGLW